MDRNGTSAPEGNTTQCWIDFGVVTVFFPWSADWVWLRWEWNKETGEFEVDGVGPEWVECYEWSE
jgi:hypothetical protein